MIEVYTGQVKELVNSMMDLCDTVDELIGGTNNYIPDSSTRDITLLALKLFCLYIATADNALEKGEADVIGEIMGKKESMKKLRELAQKAGADQDDFGSQIPLILKCAIDVDNVLDQTGKRKEMVNQEYMTYIIYKIYVMVGAFIIICDENVTVKEYNRLLRFTQTMYDKIRADLNKDIDKIIIPSSMVCQELAQFNVSNEQLSAVRRNASLGEKTIPANKEEKINKSIVAEEEEELTLEELLNQLNDLVGLSGVKYEVTSLINLCRVKQIREANGMTFPPLSLHLVFSGNPGTGKTTVARLLAKIYKKIGVLSMGHLVEVDRSGLVGGYVGQTALKVQDVIKYARGGILFIDEAYSLTNTSSQNDYGIEAVDTLVKAMEDYRNDLIVIVAGYPEPMEHFIKSNPGLKSRFNKFITFEDYKPEELVEVFKLFCKQAGYRASLDALKAVKEYFELRCLEQTEDFANAREVRNLFEQAMMRQANRIVMVTDVKPEILTLLKEEDITGKTDIIGKTEQLAQLALRGMSMDTRMGLPGEIMTCPLDELELTARSMSVLSANQIQILGDLIDYLEAGKYLEDLEGMNGAIARDVYEKLREYGYEE